MKASENIEFHIKIEKAKSNYYDSLLSTPEEGYRKLLEDINDIVNDERADSSIKLTENGN
jgi:hypothetical protein